MIDFFVPLLFGAVALHAEPAALTLGEGRGADIDITVTNDAGAPVADAQVHLAATAGELSAVHPLDRGRYRAHYTPPREHFPQVAILTATAEAGDQSSVGFVALPLSARATLNVETKPRATVHVDLGGKTLPAAVADARGKLAIQALVPPGLATATVHALDRAGNTTDKPLDLHARDFAHAVGWLAGPSPWISGANAEVQIFAVQGDGTPVTDAKQLRVASERGTLSTPMAKGPGAFAVPYRLPAQVGPGADKLTFSVDGSTTQTAVTVPLRPGPLARLEVLLDPAGYVAGSGKGVAVSARGVDNNGNVIPDAKPALATDWGRLDGAVLKVPDAFLGHTAARLTATLGTLSGTATLPLQPAAPARAEVTLPDGLVRSGEVVRGEVTVLDGFGNPIDKAPVAATTGTGHAVAVSELGGGRYALEFNPDPEEAAGPSQVQVSVAGKPLATSPGPTVLAYRRSWALSVGVLGYAQSNFRAPAVGPRVQVGMHVGRSDWEVLLEGELKAYATPLQNVPAYTGTGTVTVNQLNGLALAAGARYSKPLTQRLALHGAATLGAFGVNSTVTPNNGGPQTSDKVNVFMGRVEVGASYDVGFGRFGFQVGGTFIPAQNPNLNVHSDNLGGLSGGIGYWSPRF